MLFGMAVSAERFEVRKSAVTMIAIPMVYNEVRDVLVVTAFAANLSLSNQCGSVASNLVGYRDELIIGCHRRTFATAKPLDFPSTSTIGSNALNHLSARFAN